MENSELRAIIEAVRERTDIIDIVSKKVDLGKNNKALCPFHDEGTPSFSVHPQDQYFHCFGCGAGGDVFEFLVRLENRPFMDVLAELARNVGLSLPESSREEGVSIEKERNADDILSATAQFYAHSLTAEAKGYLAEKRGLTNETISRFQIGYAAGGLSEHLTKTLQYPVDRCIEAGVLTRGDDGTVRDFFRGRVVFPNTYRGRVVHMTGRTLDNQEPRYLHLPRKIRHLYNETDLSSTNVCLVEGVFDCLSVVQAGFSAAALLGTTRNPQRTVSKLSRCERVYLCLDGDRAGREATLQLARAIGARARIVEFPDGVDVSDYLKDRSPSEFEELLSTAKDAIEYQINQIPTDVKKTELPKKMDNVVSILAGLGKVEAEAYMRHTIKPRFALTNKEIDGYREMVREHRKGKEGSGHDEGDEHPHGVPTADFAGLVDLVDYDGRPAFLVKENDTLSVVQQVEIDGVQYVPPQSEQIPWLLPRASEVLKHRNSIDGPDHIGGKLYDDLLAYLKFVSELPSELYYDLLVAWVFHTYLSERFEYSPMVCLFAVPERGKSRTGKGLINLAYRGIHVESLRDAYIVRVANNLHATLFFDVKDIWKKAERNASEDILLLRFEKGARVPRVLYPEKGAHRDITYYKVFGPTIIGTNEDMHRILETRTVTIRMPETSRNFETDVTPEQALPLKERLVAFRARYLGADLPLIGKVSRGRLGDILRPLHQMIRLVKPEREGQFLDLVHTVEKDRLLEKAHSLEAQILEAIIDLEDEVDRGVLPVKRITDQLNCDRPEKTKVTYQRVGRRLLAMAFDKAKTSDGASAIVWDAEKVACMATAYGVQKTSETPETSETPVPPTGDTDVSDVTDVSRNVSTDDPIPF